MHGDIYAVYKGEKLIVIGTEKEICRKLHWTRSTFKWEAYPSIMAKHGAMKNRLCLVKLENDPIGEVEELLIHETEKGVRYYACSDCTFKKIYKNGSVCISKPWKHHNVYEAKICGKPINASRLLAKAFVKYDLQDDEVVIVDGKLKLENMKIVRKEKWNAKVAPKASAHRTRMIGYFEDGKLVKTYPSSRKAAADLYCSYQTILDICNHKYKREPLVDVRYV